MLMVQSPDPAFTAREVADEFERTRQWADNQLKSLEDDGLLKSKNPGGRNKFYWPSDAGKDHLRETKDRE